VNLNRKSLKIGLFISGITLKNIVKKYLFGLGEIILLNSEEKLYQEGEELDVLLLDRTLPEPLKAENIVEKAKDSFKDLPVILLTASEELNWEGKVRPDFVVPKPFTQKLLSSIVSQFGKLKREKSTVRNKILIVEDSSVTRKLLKRLLNPENKFEVLEAENGEQAKRLAFQYQDELRFISLDLYLPDTTGLELTSLFRKEELFVPIVMITSELNEEFVKEAFYRGVNLYIRKKDLNEEKVRHYLKNIITEERQKEKLPVLLIEDNPIFREVLTRHFALKGLFAVAVSSAEEALKLIKFNRFLLIMLNVVLPGMSGIEFLEKLQSLPLEDHEKLVLVYTSSHDPFILIDAFKNGATDFLQAPFGFHEFHMRIDNLLRLRKVMLKLCETQKAYYQLSITDSLTGLYNRRYFEERGELLLKEALRYGHDLSLILIDLDNFKKINDELGHHTGDEVLRQFAQKLKKLIRETDFLVRAGGDEFLIVLPREGTKEANVLLQRIRKNLPEKEFSFSAGIASLSEITSSTEKPSPYHLLEKLVQVADQRMYREKIQKKICKN